MRRTFTSGLLLVLAATQPASAGGGASPGGDCAKAVQEAFEKQRTGAGYRVQSKQPSPRGMVATQTDFLKPDRMYNKVDVPGEPAPLETIAIGRWAWASHGMGFQELQPQFAQSVTFDVNATLNTPIAAPGAFRCLGEIAYEGGQYIGYQSEPKAAAGQPEGPSNPPLARTVLVDPATGLPAFNIVAEAKPDAEPLTKAAYSYPADLKIEAPDAVPATRTR